MDEKLMRDKMGNPVPQYFNEDLEDFAVKTADGSVVTRGDVDFSRTRLLRDKLGSPIPQLWDSINNKWVVDTGQATSSGDGESGPVAWESVQDKPIEFTPSEHRHEIIEIEGLEEELEKVFTQVSSGKALLETTIKQKGSTVDKEGVIPTFKELRAAILAIESGGAGSGSSGTTLESVVIDRLVAIGLDRTTGSDMSESIMYPSNFVIDNVQIKLTEVV